LLLRSDDPYLCLLPFVEQHTEAWADRWALVISEVARRSERMGLQFAVASVRDDLEAGRL